MDDTTELGSLVQKEDDGTYTALAVFTGLDNEELAEELSLTMVEAIQQYLCKHGVHSCKMSMQ